MTKTAKYTKIDGTEFEVVYDPEGPCICCGLPVTAASMGGTVICPWCDMGRSRVTDEQIVLQHGPRDPHPKYIEHYGLSEADLEKMKEKDQ